jgi:hypothetical protein
MFKRLEEQVKALLKNRDQLAREVLSLKGNNNMDTMFKRLEEQLKALLKNRVQLAREVLSFKMVAILLLPFRLRTSQASWTPYSKGWKSR